MKSQKKREQAGGTWYLNRWWTDMGRECFFWWSRKFLGYKGGPLCTIKEEHYGE